MDRTLMAFRYGMKSLLGANTPQPKYNFYDFIARDKELKANFQQLKNQMVAYYIKEEADGRRHGSGR